MDYAALIQLIDKGLLYAKEKGENPTKVCMNQEMAAIAGHDSILGLEIKILDTLPVGKVILE